MTDRTVTVRGVAAMGDYIRGTMEAGKSTKLMQTEVTGLQKAESILAKQSALLGVAQERLAAQELKVAAATAREGVTAKELAAEQKALARAQNGVETQQARVAKASAGVTAAMEAEKQKRAEAIKATSQHALILGGALVAGLGLAEMAFMKFDAQMSNVGAASGATGKDLMALRDAALQAGAATVFSATDAARAEEELAKAGVSVQDVLSGGLIGSLNLATAGNLDLGRAAEIAASTMTQFKLAGKDIPHIADLLAAGAGKAQGSVEDLGLALKYVGPVAGQMGVSIEETSGTLAELASNGILADSAGTGLRGILMSLTAPSVKAASAMKDLGINVYDGTGKFIGFAGVAGQLHDKLGGLTNAQRDVALGTLFGNEQITAARILYAGGAQAVGDWTKKVNDSGYAARFAAARMDNLAGDLEQLKGSLETALIKQGSGANASLRFLTQSTTGFVNTIAGLPAPIQAVGTGLAALAATGLLVGGAIGTFGPKLRVAKAELEGMGRGGMAASRALSALGKASIAAAAVGGVVIGLQALNDQFNKMRGFTTTDPAEMAKSYQGMFTQIAAGRAPIKSMTTEFALWSQTVKNGGMDADLGRQGLAELDSQLSDFAAGDVKNAEKLYGRFTDALREQGYTTEQITAAFPQYAEAVKSASAAADLGAASQDNLGSSTSAAAGEVVTFTSLMTGAKLSTEAMGEAASGTTDLVKAMNDEFAFFIGNNINLTTAQANMAQAMRDAAKSVKENKRSLDQNTDAGVKNIGMFGDLINQAHDVSSRMAAVTGDVDGANLAFWRQVNAIREMGLKAGISKGSLDSMLAKMLGVAATKVKPTIDANTAAALKKINNLKVALASIKNKTVVYRFISDSTGYRPPPGAAPFVASANAEGGIIGRDHRTRTDPRDTELIWARKGEAVITPEARAMYGLTNSVVDAMNARRAVSVAGAVSGGSSSPGGGGLSDGDRALMRLFITSAGELSRLADRDAVVKFDSGTLARATREANLRQAARG